MISSAEILSRFKRGGPGGIDLTLRPAYRALLHKLGDPRLKLPPVFHVAGTNGKGSTCAFLRAMLEAAGKRVHVYTSPHLVRVHERIRVAGALVEEKELAETLARIERLSEPGAITYFEALTAAALALFVGHPADYAILEVGLGGRLDATNIIEKPLASLLTRVSFDHRDYLGDTLGLIAREKAGIMKKSVPCFSAPQMFEAAQALRAEAAKIGVPFSLGGEDWRVTPHADGFRFESKTRALDLPAPSLTGAHQFENAGLAIAALPDGISTEAIVRGLQHAEWPARLQKLGGALAQTLPGAWELWLDGGHNDSAGAALAMQAETWRKQDGKPLHLVCGMLTTKKPEEFMAPLAPYIETLRAIPIPDEASSFSAGELAARAKRAGIKNAAISADPTQALKQIARGEAGRILICGSLYLAGHILHLDLRA